MRLSSRPRVSALPITLALLVLAAMSPTPASSAEPVNITREGITVAGRAVRCEKVRTRLDDGLPNLGAAALGENVMFLNPFLLRRYPGTVQLFVFHHECGHHRVGASEFGADCWAVKRGVKDGWLDAAGLKQVCRSFGNEPDSETHPSGRRRCANLDRCFAAATTEVAEARAQEDGKAARVAQTQVQALPTPSTPPQMQARAVAPAPRLVEGPRLLWSSRAGM